MPFTKSQRLQALPPYLFIEIDKKKRALLAAGKDVINLGVGDPVLPTHKFIIDEMAKGDLRSQKPPLSVRRGVPAFRQAAAGVHEEAGFGAEMDADKNILTTIGSKDGIAHLPLAVVNPGDVVLVPQPGYPVYHSGAPSPAACRMSCRCWRKTTSCRTSMPFRRKSNAKPNSSG